MSVYLDQKFLLHIAPQLRNFKQKKENLYNFSCIFCGDSHRKATKARGYVFEHNGSYIYKCHNCAKTTGLGQLIKEIDPSSYKQYILEKFNNSNVVLPPKITKATFMFTEVKDLPLETLEGLPAGHWVLDYITQRQIPRAFWPHLFFAPDFQKFADDIYPQHGKKLIPDDPRLVIPIYNEYKVLCGFSGRALKNFELRYIIIKLVNDVLKCYGMDTVDFSKRIYVTEGPIDSMFLPNAVATHGSDLMKTADWLPKKNLVLIYDNEYHKPEVRKFIEKAINQDFKVCIWPKAIKQKDINDLIVKEGLTPETIKSIIDENTFSGIRAKMELSNVTN